MTDISKGLLAECIASIELHALMDLKPMMWLTPKLDIPNMLAGMMGLRLTRRPKQEHAHRMGHL
jgi:hypothetical protein